jgi:hypothetical protein
MSDKLLLAVEWCDRKWGVGGAQSERVLCWGMNAGLVASWFFIQAKEALSTVRSEFCTNNMEASDAVAENSQNRTAGALALL